MSGQDTISQGSISREAAESIILREADNLAHLADIGFEVSVELGRKRMHLSQFEALEAQDTIDLNKLAGEAFDIRVNGHLFGEGEILVMTDTIACRVTSMHVPSPSRPAGLLREVIGEPSLEQAEYEEVESVKDMIFIPAGRFVMGTNTEDSSPPAERPAHKVLLAPYYIDAFPVTNLDYRYFIRDTGHAPPIHWRRGDPPDGTMRHPVVNVSWHDATAYANWIGKRLPTEAEWEKAARGTDERLYPWGNRYIDGRCNSNNLIGTTVVVDEYPHGRSPYGVWDMSGNVYEWCQDYYDEAYYQYSPDTSPQGPEGGQERVIRGGFFAETRPNVRTTHRSCVPHTHTRENVGFRLVLDADVTDTGESAATEGSHA